MNPNEQRRSSQWTILSSNALPVNSITFFLRRISLTAVYKKIKFRRLTPSLVSVDEPMTRWSTLSGLSVADTLSRILVFSLAITPVEVYNDSQYVLSSTDEPLIAPQPSQEQTESQPNHELAHSSDPTNAPPIFPQLSQEQLQSQFNDPLVRSGNLTGLAPKLFTLPTEVIEIPFCHLPCKSMI